MNRAFFIALGVVAPFTAAAAPLEPDTVRDLIISTARTQGIELVPEVSRHRGFPPCSTDPSVTSHGGSWRMVRVACPDPAGWQRLVRTSANHAPADQRTVDGTPDGGMPILVLAESLPRGTILAPHHIAQTVKASVARYDLVKSVEHAVGRRLRSNLGAGQPILARHLDHDWLVEQDAPVTIALSDPAILIEASGIAVEPGQLGEDIRVRNLSSNRIVHVTVTGPNKVQVRPNMR